MQYGFQLTDWLTDVEQRATSSSGRHFPKMGQNDSKFGEEGEMATPRSLPLSEEQMTNLPEDVQEALKKYASEQATLETELKAKYERLRVDSGGYLEGLLVWRRFVLHRVDIFLSPKQTCAVIPKRHFVPSYLKNKWDPIYELNEAMRMVF